MQDIARRGRLTHYFQATSRPVAESSFALWRAQVTEVSISMESGRHQLADGVQQAQAPWKPNAGTLKYFELAPLEAPNGVCRP